MSFQQSPLIRASNLPFLCVLAQNLPKALRNEKGKTGKSVLLGIWQGSNGNPRWYLKIENWHTTTSAICQLICDPVFHKHSCEYHITVENHHPTDTNWQFSIVWHLLQFQQRRFSKEFAERGVPLFVRNCYASSYSHKQFMILALAVRLSI